MSIDPKTNDYVPVGKWLAAPGSVLESGLYALAMAMATDPEDTRPLLWSSDALEKRYYDALKAVQTQHIKYTKCNEDRALSRGDLGEIMKYWHGRYRYMYRLHIDDNDCISTVNYMPTTGKIILLRRVEDHWQACCHFEGKATGFTISPTRTLFSWRGLQVETPAETTIDKAEDNKVQTATEEVDNFVPEPTTTSVPVNSMNDALVKTLETLVSGIKELTLATETRLESDRALCTAVNKLTASLDEANQAQAHTSFNTVMNDRTYQTSSEDGSTPSTP